MIYFPYSRTETIKKIKESYIRYLENLCHGNIPGADLSVSRNCMYHALCPDIFSQEVNKLAFDIISRVAESTGCSDRYIKKAVTSFAEKGYGACGINKEINSGCGTDAVRENAETSVLMESIFLAFNDNKKDDIPEYMDRALSLLLKHFEVKGRIHERYADGLKKGMGKYDITDNYVLLAANLLKWYNRSGNIKVLNTVLKLNDLIKILLDREVNCEPLPLVVYSFTEEEKAVRGLYDTRGFRMPADR